MRIRDFFKPNEPLRQGLLEATGVGGGLLNSNVKYKGIIEIEELERVGKLSHIKIKKISGMPNTAKDLIPDWIPTEDITWIQDEATDSQGTTTPPTGEHSTQGQASSNLQKGSK